MRPASGIVAIALCGGCNLFTDTDSLTPSGPSGPSDAATGPSTELLPSGPTGAENAGLPMAPFDWPGKGILARRLDGPPTGPGWTTVLAEVQEDGTGRFLVATGVTRGIRNMQLARNAADNRARAELGRWVGQEKIVGSEVIDHFTDGLITVARVRMPVAADWQPSKSPPPTP